MTPLAAFLAKQLTSRPKDRIGIWTEPKNIPLLWDALNDIHCFEVTKCLPIMMDIVESYRGDVAKADSIFSKFTFLPAQKTWIEWSDVSTKNRIGILLSEQGDKANVDFFCNISVQELGHIRLGGGEYEQNGGLMRFPTWLQDKNHSGHLVDGLISFAHNMLVLINSPKIIGRQQFMPNAGLERRMKRRLGPGKFPLHAWTEIQLKVNKPPEIDDGEPHEAHLTGTRALHFCRKHIRIRLGQLEYVSAHWRGDPSIGIKQSRYVVSP